MLPRLYLGTMTFGWTAQTSSPVEEAVAQQMVERFIDFDRCVMKRSTHCIDTARIYASGQTEQIVGTVLTRLSDEQRTAVWIGTKAAPSACEEGLSPAGIQTQFKTSMECLNGFGGSRDGRPLSLVAAGSTSTSTPPPPPTAPTSLYEYYLHQPDTGHDLLDSLREVDRLVRDNQIQKVGMSNYHWTEVERAFQLCEQYGLTKPSVYQGLYNPLNRMVEDDLLPLLARHDCAFIAYNPLAGGLLTGKHQFESDNYNADDNERGGSSSRTVKTGRFYKNPNYLPRFYTKSNFDALQVLQDQCRKDGITLIEATFQWLLQESQLDARKGDGVLLGASSLAQLDENLAACQRVVAAADGKDADSAGGGDTTCVPTPSSSHGRLSDEMRHAFDVAWHIVRSDQDPGPFCYWRGYSSDMPGRNKLHQGASYDAAKVVK